MPRLALTSLLLLACAWCWPGHVDAQVRQCIAGDGSLVYTDRKCEDIGGRDRPLPSSPGAIGGSSPARSLCARSIGDLTYSLSNAIQSGDANKIAGVYDWSGMSSGNAYRLMDRLDAIARRPLVDVQPMYSGGTNEYGDGIVEFDEQTGQAIAKPARKPRLIGLRVEQTLVNGTTPSRTVFGLRKSMGCWWVRL